jgi:F420-dependent oxidoreductase-like protein
MKVGIEIRRFVTPEEDAGIAALVAGMARAADQGGLDSLWMMDHFFQFPGVGEAEEPMLEGYSALSYLAGITERISLGTLVTGVTYRHPGILVKTVTTLDVLSGGRARLGIGVGWYEREHLGLGVPFPPVAERFERLEETLQIALQMWSGEVGSYEGRHYTLAETLCRPLPLSRSHPPILIGGGGEQKTLRLVARYADACNLFAPTEEALATLPHKLDVLRAHCEREGRPYEAIEKTTTSGIFETPAAAVDLLSRLAELGIAHHIFGVIDAATVEAIATQVLPYVPDHMPAGTVT